MFDFLKAGTSTRSQCLPRGFVAPSQPEETLSFMLPILPELEQSCEQGIQEHVPTLLARHRGAS